MPTCTKQVFAVKLSSAIFSSVVLGSPGTITSVNTFTLHETRSEHMITGFLKYTHELKIHLIQPCVQISVSAKTFRESGSGMISIAVNICPEQLADYLYNNLISAILNNTNIFFSSFVPWQWCHFKYSLYKYATLELPKNCIRYSSWH